MTHTQETLIAGVLQFDITTGEIDANLASAVSGISRLSEKGTRLAVLPELWSCGFDTPEMLGGHADKTPELIKTLTELAINHQMIIAGSLPEKANGRLYNSMVVIDKNGSVAGTYRKIHLFALMGEDKAFTAGNQAMVCSTSCGPVGLMICYDLRFPELCRSLTVQGARIIIVSAQWPESRIHHWNTLLQARAIENQVFVAASNRTGRDNDLVFNGYSQIISPDGTVLSCIPAVTGEATAQIDFHDIDRARSRFNCLNDRIPAAYTL